MLSECEECQEIMKWDSSCIEIQSIRQQLVTEIRTSFRQAYTYKTKTIT